MNKQILKVICKEQIQDLLQNTETIIERTSSLEKEYDAKEITIISGVRRCGKSSLLNKFARDLSYPELILYANFDDPRLAEF